SHQHGAAVHHGDLASAEAPAHQVEVGSGNVLRLADATDRQDRADVTVERLAIARAHLPPQRCVHHARRYRIDADRCEFDRERAGQCIHGTADARWYGPARAWPQAGDAGCEHDRATGADVGGRISHCGIGAPEADLEKLPRGVEPLVGQRGELHVLAGGEDEMIESTDAVEEHLDRVLGREVDDVTFTGRRQRAERAVDAGLPAGCDDQGGALRGGGFGDRQSNSGSAAEYDDALSVECHGRLHFDWPASRPAPVKWHWTEHAGNALLSGYE